MAADKNGGQYSSIGRRCKGSLKNVSAFSGCLCRLAERLSGCLIGNRASNAKPSHRTFSLAHAAQTPYNPPLFYEAIVFNHLMPRPLPGFVFSV